MSLYKNTSSMHNAMAWKERGVLLSFLRISQQQVAEKNYIFLSAVDLRDDFSFWKY
jgi:hypothetical protein